MLQILLLSLNSSLLNIKILYTRHQIYFSSRQLVLIPIVPGDINPKPIVQGFFCTDEEQENSLRMVVWSEVHVSDGNQTAVNHDECE
jgi:hypothetical protein